MTCALLLMGYLLWQIPQTQAMMQEKEKQQDMNGISPPSTSLPSHGPPNRDLVKEQLWSEAEENNWYEWAHYTASKLRQTNFAFSTEIINGGT